jgi:glutamate racemase
MPERPSETLIQAQHLFSSEILADPRSKRAKEALGQLADEERRARTVFLLCTHFDLISSQ